MAAAVNPDGVVGGASKTLADGSNKVVYHWLPVLVAFLAVGYIALIAALSTTYSFAEVSKPTLIFTSAKAYLSVNTPNATTLYSTPLADTTATKQNLSSYLLAIGASLAAGYGVTFLVTAVQLGSSNTQVNSQVPEKQKQYVSLIVHTTQYGVNCIVWSISGQLFLYLSGNKTSEASYGVAAASVGLASCIYFVEALLSYVGNAGQGKFPVELITIVLVVGVATPIVLTVLIMYGIVGLAYSRTARTNVLNDFMNTGFTLYATTIGIAFVYHAVNVLILFGKLEGFKRQVSTVSLNVFFHCWTFVYVSVFLTYAYRNFQTGYAL